MTSREQPDADHGWEKELTPKITRGRLAAGVVLYCAWATFLAVLGYSRWFGSLQ